MCIMMIAGASTIQAINTCKFLLTQAENQFDDKTGDNADINCKLSEKVSIVYRDDRMV